MFLILLISFFNVSAPTEIYTYCHTLALHDARPISDYAQPHAGHSGREGPHPFRTGQGPAQPDRLHHRRGETSDAPCPAPMGRGAGTGRSRSRSGPPATFRDSRSHRGDAGMTMRRPWIVVLSAALIVTLAMGVRQSFGLFMPQMSIDRKSTRLNSQSLMR